MILAGLGALLVGGSLVRIIGLEIVTRSTRRKWMATARPITLPYATIPAYVVSSRFPLVAVVGVRRPTLVIAETILKQCTTDELAAIVAHEEGHVRRRDNLRRAILASVPDLLRWLPVSRHMEADWDEATEQCADDGAARIGPGGRLYLANALIRVARMVPAGIHLSDVPASALYRGEALERRISRLLDPATSVAANDQRIRRWPLMAGAAAVTASMLALPAVHEIFEILVNVLP
jgi:beta-lactamase regulating signal transducer with metallopeptidase domain